MKHSLPILYLSMVALYQPFLMATYQGYSGIEPPKTNDTTFVLDAGPIEATGVGQGAEGECPSPFSTDRCIPLGPNGSITFRILVNRVVGDVNADGTLASPVELVNNGVVSQFARLRLISGYTIDGTVIHNVYAPPHFRVLFNDQDIGPVQYVPCGECTDYRLDEYQIPIEWVRFGKKNSGGGIPISGENEVTLRMGPYGGDPRDTWGITVDWAAITFEALAPVVMIHGIDSTGAWFDRNGFTSPFKSQKIPYDNTITMDSDSIPKHGALLAGLVKQRADQFGVKWVHLVAHSKGGLDSRDFLARTIPADLGVLSFITLDTPHHGSVAADYAVDSRDANFMFSDSPRRVLLAKLVGSGPGTFDLRVSEVERFNQDNLTSLPNEFTVNEETRPITYLSFSADANTDDSKDFWGKPTIGVSEVIGMDSIYKDFLAVGVYQEIYRLVGDVKYTRLEYVDRFLDKRRIVREIPNPEFELNDIVVTLRSARARRFSEIASLKRNHGTIGNSEVAIKVIQTIRSLQQ